jgi:hypothetical protein
MVDAGCPGGDRGPIGSGTVAATVDRRLLPCTCLCGHIVLMRLARKYHALDVWPGRELSLYFT